VGYVDTLYLIALGIAGIAVESTPPEACRPYEEIVEDGNIDGSNKKTSQPPFEGKMIPVK